VLELRQCRKLEISVIVQESMEVSNNNNDNKDTFGSRVTE
jgi:hypothetical protein